MKQFNSNKKTRVDDKISKIFKRLNLLNEVALFKSSNKVLMKKMSRRTKLKREKYIHKYRNLDSGIKLIMDQAW